MIHYYHKDWGETMGDCLARFQAGSGITEPVTYAGRLDPAADGVVLFLSGPDRMNKQSWLQCDKQYRLQIAFGISTDTNDILGLVTATVQNIPPLPPRDQLSKLLEQYTGTHTRQFPAFSSRRYMGKPLWHHARNNTMPKIQHTYTISDIALEQVTVVPYSTVLEKNLILCQLLTNRGHDFRQQDIIDSWQQNRATMPAQVPVLTLLVTCTSGTYMRQLATDIGDALHTPAIAYHITRTRLFPKTEVVQ